MVREQLNGMVDAVRIELRKADIGYTALGVHGRQVTVTLRDPGQFDRTHSIPHHTIRTRLTTSAMTYARYACRLPACSTFMPWATRRTVRASGT